VPLEGTGGTVLVPQDAPEVAELKRWPRRNSHQWNDRYQEAIDLFEKMVAALPTTNERVMLATVELSEAMRRDFIIAKAEKIANG
jgi:hypothetical protein